MSGFTDRLIDDVCVLFGFWAIWAQVVVFAGGTLFHLMASALLLLPILLAVWRHVRMSSPGPLAAVSRAGPWAGETFVTATEAGAVVLAMLACAAVFLARPIALWWVSIVAAGLGAAGFLGVSRIRLTPLRLPRAYELMLCGLALTLGLVAVFAHRYNFDDSLYVHVSVSAIDRPDVPLLSEETIHGFYGRPSRQPANRVRAYELLIGAVAYATGARPIFVFHVVAAFLAALLIPLAWAKLFRLLTPRHWLVATAVLIALYLGVGETNRWYSNFSVVRIWQGKSIFLSVFLPAVYAYGIEFSARPSRRRALLLMAAQSASMGFTSSALWAAPAAAGLGLLTGARSVRSALRTVPLGMAAGGFVFATAIVARNDLGRMVQGLRAYRIPDPGAILSEALALVFGNGRLLGLSFLVLAGGWVFSRRGTMARRFAVVASFVPMLIMLNPYWIGWVRSSVTGDLYWRALWALPVPALLTLALVSPLHLGRRRWTVRRRSVMTVACVGAFLLWVPAYSAVGRRNLVEWGPPGLKVDKEAYALAGRVNDSVAEGSYVIAPEGAARWIPTFVHHAYPLKVRDYLALPLREEGRRRRMVEFADGDVRTAERRREFEEALRRFAVRGVCLRVTGKMGPIYRVLMERGFHRSFADRDWEIWVRGVS